MLVAALTAETIPDQPAGLERSVPKV